jgi:hypothetical protein
MGVKRDPAVRLCVTCGKLKSADQFAPRRRKCLACQRLQPSRANRPGTPHDPHDAARARARDQALRRLGLEHLDAYRELYRAKRRQSPDTAPAARPATGRSAARSGHWSSSSAHAMSSCTSRSSRELGRKPIRDGPAGRWAAQIDSRSRRKRHRRGGGMGRATANPARMGSGRGDGPLRRRSGNALSHCFARAARPPPSPRNSASPGRPRPSDGPLAIGWRRSITKPTAWPAARGARQPTAGDRAGPAQGREGPRL